ncbi:MAG: transposase, partial [Betaproteobacteria bacterium]|nr:transposase [Betaproteobacteria bacterium]
MTMSHDSLNKLLYSFSPVVRDLVLGFTKDKWLHGLDF